MKTQFKRLTASFLALMMCLSLFGVNVWADDTPTRGTTFTDPNGNVITDYGLEVGGARVTSENAANICRGETVTASFDPATNTLTLDNFNFSCGEGDFYAVHSNGSLIIEVKSDSTVAGRDKGDHPAVWVNGDLTITGPGKLTAFGMTALGGGIHVNGNLTVNGTLEANGNAFGVYATDTLTVNGILEANGGTVNGNDETGEGASSHGVSAKNVVIGQGGTLTATSGKSSKGGSSGVDAWNITLAKNATLTATSGDAPKTNSFGIIVNGKVTLAENATLTAVSGRANWISYGVSAWNITLDKNAKLTAAGGTAGDYSSGVFVGTMRVDGKLKATGGTVSGTNGYSYGICADSIIVSKESEIIAKGGKASNSYDIHASSVNGKLTTTTLSSVKYDKESKTVTVQWKVNRNFYELQYSTDKKFKKSVKTVNIKNNKTTKTTIKKLKKGTYYVRIRTVNGKKTSAWSKTKSVKVK